MMSCYQDRGEVMCPIFPIEPCSIFCSITTNRGSGQDLVTGVVEKVFLMGKSGYRQILTNEMMYLVCEWCNNIKYILRSVLNQLFENSVCFSDLVELKAAIY